MWFELPVSRVQEEHHSPARLPSDDRSRSDNKTCQVAGNDTQKNHRETLPVRRRPSFPEWVCQPFIMI
jgi:hypothetical protein